MSNITHINFYRKYKKYSFKFYWYTLIGFDVLLGGVHGRVVDGEHAGRSLRLDGAEDELAGAVGLLAQEKVEEGELVHVVRDLHLAALKLNPNMGSTI